MGPAERMRWRAARPVPRPPSYGRDADAVPRGAPEDRQRDARPQHDRDHPRHVQPRAPDDAARGRSGDGPTPRELTAAGRPIMMIATVRFARRHEHRLSLT